MQISILSDLHLGYNREEDAYKQAKEALDTASKADLILLAGDLFDQRVPRQETLAKALELFSKIDKPVVAISGTHERRSSGYINPVQTLEKAGFIEYLHCKSKTIEIQGKKVNIFGMSGVPEKYARDILQNWSPKPLEGINILLLHQNLKEYIYNPFEPTTISLSDLPKGFDLFVCGHIHWHDISKTPQGTPVLLPGSTIRTQLKKAELVPKGVTFYTPPDKLEFTPLKTQKRFFYETLKFEEATPQEIQAKLKHTLSKMETKDSLIKLKLTGTLAKNIRPADISTRTISSDAALLSIDKDFETETKSKKEVAHTYESIEELGLRLLREKIGSDPEPIFHHLRDGKLDLAKEKLLS